MILPWIVAVAALALAAGAWARTRQHARRLEQLSQMYWELKYQYGELRSAPRPTTGAQAPRAATDAFVPLASLKR
jgi:hypothetical protein